MKWSIKISKEARKEYKNLDKGARLQVLAGILKVSKNPLPHPEGYGKPLGNKRGKNLTGFFKIKYKDIGIRVVYTLVLEEYIMNVIYFVMTMIVYMCVCAYIVYTAAKLFI